MNIARSSASTPSTTPSAAAVVSRPRHRSAALLLGLLAAFALLFGAALASPSAAVAHDQLLSSSPADGETLDAAPSEATLEYSGEIQPIGLEILVSDASGTAIELPDEPVVSGMTVTQALPTLAPGDYTLDWRVVSGDGHPIAGSIAFSVAGAAATEPAEGDASAAPVVPSFGGGTSTAFPDASAGAGESAPVEQEDVSLWLLPLLGLVGVVVVVVAILGARAALKRNDEMRERAEAVERQREQAEAAAASDAAASDADDADATDASDAEGDSRP